MSILFFKNPQNRCRHKLFVLLMAVIHLIKETIIQMCGGRRFENLKMKTRFLGLKLTMNKYMYIYMEKMSRICTQSFYSQTQKDVIILARNSFYQKIMEKKAKPTSFNHRIYCVENCKP